MNEAVRARSQADDVAPGVQPDSRDRRGASRFVSWAPSQRRSSGALIALWAIALAGFLAWWFHPSHVVSLPRLVFTSVLLGWVVVMPAWFLFFIRRVSVPAADTPLPTGRFAMVVTRAPSEPWPVVQRTLEGALAQSTAHDTWLADECPDEEILRWCLDNGVRVSTRFGVDDYHRDSWPRRTRCKEGNLAWFYDTVGYRSYDIVIQLDADHVPGEGYLDAMLRPFGDPAVGYVSAPSICDANSDRSWAVRARAFAEAPLHGALQAGANDGFAPLCIGSHYAVRTRALRDIGGLGPELAEDHSTTLLMNAHGWRGVHAVDAIALGDGPESFSDLMVQEFQWSRSLVNLLLGFTPRHASRLPRRLQIQFLFSQLWYPAFGLVMLASVIAPIFALRTATPLMRMPYLHFLAFSAALSTILLAIVAWVRRQGLFRPIDAPIVSWEAGLFQVLRWPWVLAGVGAAVADTLRGTAFPFQVTPKADDGAKPLPFRMIAPHLSIAAVSAAAALSFDDVGAAKGYYWFTIANAALYTTAVAVVVLLHRRENRTRTGAKPLRLHLGVVLCVGLVTAVACSDRAGDMGEALTWTGDTATRGRVIDVASGSVNLGVYDFAGDFTESNRFAIEHHFVDWRVEDAESIRDLVAPGGELGRWPLVSIEPFAVDGRTDTVLADTAAGLYDEQITEICSGLVDIGTPSFVRWGHEMDVASDRYPWAGADPAAYIEAFQHVATTCRSILGDDLFLVWSPIGSSAAPSYFPGEDHVDYVGLPLYDFPAYNESVGLDPDLSFDDLFSPRYDLVASYGLPIMIAEFGSARVGDDQLDWLDDAFASTPDYPLLRTVVFFQAPDTPGVWGEDVETPQWRIDPSTLPNGDTSG